MPTPPALTTEALARLVQQKRRLLEQLVQLGQRQGELISAGEVATLVQLLSGKQQLIAGLQAVEQGLDAFRDQDPDARAWPSPAERAACRADSQACNELLARVIATEQQHEAQMSERRDEVSTQLRQAQSAHAASTAYKPHLRAPRRPPIAPLLDTPNSVNASLDLTTSD